MAAVTAQSVRDKGIKLAGQVLRQPALCHHKAYPSDLPHDSYHDFTSTDVLTQEWLDYLYGVYADGADVHDKRFSPLVGKVEGLCPAYIQCAGMDRELFVLLG